MSWKEQEAIAVWRSTCEELRRGDSFEAAERLLVLTMLLSEHFGGKREALRQRALFESALDLFRLPRHRQVVHGLLARFASYAGDAQGAEMWLSPCNPRSADLEADTAYRLARATLDTAQGNSIAVLQTLGRFHGDVPILDSEDAHAVVLRAHAHEQRGDLSFAAVELERYSSTSLTAVPNVLHRLAVDHGWHLCQASLPLAQGKVANRDANDAKALGMAALSTFFFFAFVVTVVVGAIVIAVLVFG